MAVLIPNEANDSSKTTPGDGLVGKTLQGSFPEDTWVWYNPPKASNRPRFVVVAPEFGVVGIDVCDWTPSAVQEAGRSGVRLNDGQTCNPVSDLGSRLEDLRARLCGIRPEPPLQGLIVMPGFSDKDARAKGLDKCFPPDLLVTRDRLSQAGLTQSLDACRTRLTSDVFAGVRDRLYPDTSFQRLRLVMNDGHAEREAIRIQLNAQQENLAHTIDTSVTLVRGVAGSGKSLILAARARHLSSMQPNWTIQVLCFNSALVSYLQGLIGGDCPNVQVSTFHAWIRNGLHLWLPWVKDDDDQEMEKRQIEKAISTGNSRQTYDAILVDEGQDFRPVWYQLLQHTLRPSRGGLLVVMDRAQAIYQEPSFDELFSGNVAVFSLRRNYRNTKQIGEFAHDNVFGNKPAKATNARCPLPSEYVSEGDQVQVVWAATWDGQAEFIAAEIERLVREIGISYRDIAVLYPRWAGTGRINDALANAGIPHFRLQKSQASKAAFDLDEDSVKVLTVHAAKGLEFPVVFLFGSEAVQVPADFAQADEEEANKARTLYVGMTRATDILYLTYTKLKGLAERAASQKCRCEFRKYPDDFDS